MDDLLAEVVASAGDGDGDGARDGPDLEEGPGTSSVKKGKKKKKNSKKNTGPDDDDDDAEHASGAGDVDLEKPRLASLYIHAADRRIRPRPGPFRPPGLFP